MESQPFIANGWQDWMDHRITPNERDEVKKNKRIKNQSNLCVFYAQDTSIIVL